MQRAVPNFELLCLGMVVFVRLEQLGFVELERMEVLNITESKVIVPDRVRDRLSRCLHSTAIFCETALLLGHAFCHCQALQGDVMLASTFHPRFPSRFCSGCGGGGA